MTLMARPGLHHAPVPGGVFVSGVAGELALRGSDVLALALDTIAPALHRGASETELAELLGGEPARPLVRAVLTQLLAHDLLLDLDTLSLPPPSDAVRGRHAEALAHLESVDPDPYATFARLQSTTVRVHGAGAPMDAVRRGLLRAGVGDVVPGHPAEADLVVALDATDDDAPRVVVQVADRVALVSVRHPGAPTTDLWRRVRAWADRLNRGDLPRPGADVAAAGYAVVLALDVLRDPANAVREAVPAMVLSGLGAQAETVRLSRTVSGTVHRLERAHRGHLRDLAPDPDKLRELVEAAAAPWSGGHDAAGGLDLPQLPDALRLGVPIAHRGPSRVATAADQAAVSLSLALQLRRDAGGPAGAAGTTRLRWLLDGVLRHLAARPVHGLDWVRATSGGHLAWARTDAEARDDAAALARAAEEAARSAEPATVAAVGTDALVRATDVEIARLAHDVLAMNEARGVTAIGVRAVDDPALPAPDDGVSLWSGPVRLEADER
ncbi:hypothetical protein GCM10023340_33040 [Nocardioides marinquilinus]|uniref:Helicase XPB/Ssl2 N-terminal domain-containing protein n=1 Tax=Nocardioides marinquilinus TaxID=1210400 RepID=A0ABP9PW88_9ACTN